MKKTYNHAYDIAFAVRGSHHPTGDDMKAPVLRAALLKRIHDLSDDELLEALGMPFDSHEEESKDLGGHHG